MAKGASREKVWGNQFLDSIRYCEALIHIVRCFEDDNVVHINNSVDPIRDKEEVDIELQFKDLEVVEKSIERNKKAAKGGDKKTLFIIELLEKIKSHLENGGYVRDLNFNNEENKILKAIVSSLQKKILYVANVGDDSLEGNKYLKHWQTISKKTRLKCLYSMQNSNRRLLK